MQLIAEAVLHLQDEQFTAPEFLTTLLSEAVRLSASDVHIDPERNGTRVQVRIDGLLELVGMLPASQHAALLARVKIISNLRTDEHKTAQDGRFDVSIGSERVHVRVAVMPCYFGERVVLRILRDDRITHDLSAIGMPSEQQEVVRTVLRMGKGMILVSGPTGSGKTTTLYTLLRVLQRPGVSVVTLEDPVEYVLDEIVQVPIEARHGVSFATGLRSVLRQDPDIIMVGEIRDVETARLAAQAALTGHVVISSIHTSEAATVFVRLRDLGLEPYLLSSTVRLVIAQRLVRLVCHACDNPTLLEVESVCTACRGRGYSGRCGVFEVVMVNQHMRTLLESGGTVSTIRDSIRSNGVQSLLERGSELIVAGSTTQAELNRALQDTF